MPARVYSSSGSSSEYDSEVEDFEVVLKAIGMNRKYGKMFARAKIEDLDDARDLTERKLRKLGISSSSERRKILKAIAEATTSDSDDSETESSDDSSSSESSESEEEMNEVERKLRKYGLEKFSRKLAKHKITTIRSARKLTDSKLKQIGVDSSRSRSKILSLFKDSTSSSSKSRRSRTRNYPKKKSRRSSTSTHSSTSCSSSSKSSKRSKSPKVDEKKIILKVLKDAGLQTVGIKFIENDIVNFRSASNLTLTSLKELGFESFSIRSRILDLFRNENLERYKRNARKSRSNSNSDDEVSPILTALKRVKMQKHFDIFKKSNINSARKAQELDHDKLLDLGISNEGQRALIMECFREADWKCVYCQTWNEHRKTCVVCQKTHRVSTSGSTEGNEADGFQLNERVKYVGKFRPTTKTSHGSKGEIHRVLENGEFYMVKFQQKDGKILKIRLNRSELRPIKNKTKRSKAKM